jgi:hypothetical protein
MSMFVAQSPYSNDGGILVMLLVIAIVLGVGLNSLARRLGQVVQVLQSIEQKLGRSDSASLK